MKDVLNILAKIGLACRQLNRYDIKSLGSRKKVDIYFGVTPDNYYCLIFKMSKKSRFIKKDALDLIELKKRLENREGLKVLKLYLILDAPLCSKAKELLNSNGWRVFNEF